MIEVVLINNINKEVMRKRLIRLSSICLSIALFASCSSDDNYTLKKEDVTVEVPKEGVTASVNKEVVIDVVSISDEGVHYEWFLDDESISTNKSLVYTFVEAGEYDLKLVVTQDQSRFEFKVLLTINLDGKVTPVEDATPYLTKVFDYMPAVGQFTNKLPEYKEGDTQEDMNAKVLAQIGNGKKSMITLGGYGGYVVVGFDHTIENRPGLRDFRVLGNAFYAAGNPDPTAPVGGSCEPGIIMVAYDSNGNGKPDENEWYEIAGSSHKDVTKELFYAKGIENGNDMNFHSDFEITYYKPEVEPETAEDKLEYIRWEDNKGNSGYKVKNGFHNQPYYPLWAKGDKLTFKGSRLPENGIDESGQGNYYVLYKLLYGYADNEKNDSDDSAIDIDWAINSKGQKVKLPGVDFIKVYTGVNQENGWLGENSTEFTGIVDLHVNGEEVKTIEE